MVVLCVVSEDHYGDIVSSDGEDEGNNMLV